MNFDYLQNINTHIETEDRAEKEEALSEKIKQISLVYTEKKFQEIREENKDYKLSEAVKTFSPTRNIIVGPLYKLDNFSVRDNKEKIDQFLDDFYSELDSSIDSNNPDLDKISDLISLKRGSIKKYLGVESLKELKEDEDQQATKILNFNRISDSFPWDHNDHDILRKEGFKEKDSFVEFHVKDFYNTDEKNLGPGLIKNDLSIVAEYIVDVAPETRAVIGKSWLLDTPLADRLGFKRLEGDPIAQTNDATWAQFIDKNGQIDKKRFNEFLDTGELKYKGVRGYIKTEDFLKRYLPENRKGKINLKEVNEDRVEFWKNFDESINSVKIKWAELIKSDSSFESFSENNEDLNKVADLFDSPDREEYINFLKLMYENKTPWHEFAKYRTKAINEAGDRLDKKIINDRYKVREVIIE